MIQTNPKESAPLFKIGDKIILYKLYDIIHEDSPEFTNKTAVIINLWKSENKKYDYYKCYILEDKIYLTVHANYDEYCGHEKIGELSKEELIEEQKQYEFKLQEKNKIWYRKLLDEEEEVEWNFNKEKLLQEDCPIKFLIEKTVNAQSRNSIIENAVAFANIKSDAFNRLNGWIRRIWVPEEEYDKGQRNFKVKIDSIFCGKESKPYIACKDCGKEFNIEHSLIDGEYQCVKCRRYGKEA